MTEVGRDTHIAEQVVFVDGLSGTGKTMMGPILSSFNRMEVQRFDQIHEYICQMNYLGRVEADAAKLVVQTFTDIASYNVMIGRETNFRWKDLSGVFANPGGWRYLRRLFQPDGDAVMDRINQIRPILQIHLHQLLGVSQPLFSALGSRLTMVEMVRHPVFLLQHWYGAIGRFGADPRAFSVCIRHNGKLVPWFAVGWEDKFQESNNMDRVIYLIEWFTRLADDALAALDEASRRQVLVVPFEKFVVEPWPYLRKMEDLLGTNTTKSTGRTLRKQKVPRRLTTAGLDLEIYRRYGWNTPRKGTTEAGELQTRLEFAANKATPEGMSVLEQISQAYESRYLAKACAEV